MSTERNKKIAKNTVFLTIRVLVVTLISLYTSRVILQELGVDDYGIYNIVGGFVALVNFLTFAISAAMQRFLRKEIEQHNNFRLQNVYSSCCVLAVLSILVTIIVLELIGTWFVLDKLNIPSSRIDVAFIVLQFSIFNVCCEIFKQIFHSLLVSYEKMNFYAYISIADAVLKLGVVYFLSIISFDKLILFSALQSFVAFGILAISGLYCYWQFSNVRFSFKTNIKDLREIVKFSFWNSISSMSDVAYMHGSNILVNLFFGVTVNAAMGITNQVKSAVYTLTRNIQMAANPQILGYYSTGDYIEGRKLVFRISRFSYYIMLLLGLPLFLNVDYILSIWLVKIPPYCPDLIRSLILFCMFDIFSGPLWTSMQGKGKIRNYQLIISAILLLNLPLTYIAFSCNMPPYVLYLIQSIVVTILLFIRVWFAKKYCGFGFRDYFKSVISKALIVTFISTILPIIVAFTLKDVNFVNTLISVVVSVVSVSFAVYFYGMEYSERNMIDEKIKHFLRLK